jgi:hypothetical protein
MFIVVTKRQRARHGRCGLLSPSFFTKHLSELPTQFVLGLVSPTRPINVIPRHTAILRVARRHLCPIATTP